jgi:hypothetical protein
MPIIFPIDPEIGQEFVGSNAVTYEWTGNRWSTLVPVIANRAFHIAVGGKADTQYNDLNFYGGGGA